MKNKKNNNYINIFISILLIILIGCFYLNILITQQRKEIETYLLELAKKETEIIYYEIQNNFYVMDTLIDKTKNNEVVELKKVKDNFNNIILILNGKQFNLLNEEKTEKEQIDIDKENYDLAMRGKKSLAKENNGNYYYYLPITKNNKIEGVMIGILSTEKIEKVINTNKFNNEGYSHLIDNKGNILIRSNNKNSNKIVKNIYEVKFETEKIKEEINKNKSGIISMYYPNDKIKKVMAYVPIEKYNLYITTFIPEHILNEEFKKIIILTILLLLFITIIIIILIKNINKYKKINYYTQKIYRELKEKKETKQKVEKALKNKELKLYIQPQYDKTTEKIIGGEILLRWLLNGKLIFPNEFIPKLEETNLIEKIDLYILETICIKIKEWENKKYPKMKIAINQSQKNLLNSNYINKIKKILKNYKFTNHQLEIELTENIFIENKKVIKDLEKELHQLNVLIAIDDFGTGYSSYNMLKEVNIDILKLDRKMFENLENKKTQIIINGIIDMAKKLNIKIIAEGIETEQQLLFLKTTNCDIIQGYYFSKPIELEVFEKILKEQKKNN